jgi:hypothetical protein
VVIPEDLWASFADRGLVLLTDPVLPAVAQALAGPISGSWWGHPEGKRIFAVATAMDDHPDVVATRLVCKKVTFVHRKLWPALLGAALSGDAWQSRGITQEERAILASLGTGTLRAEDRPGSAPTLKRLEERLLVRGWDEHLPSGRHGRRVEPWAAWAAREGVAAAPRGPLEAAITALGPTARPPWPVEG